jgi:hypothetical protein
MADGHPFPHHPSDRLPVNSDGVVEIPVHLHPMEHGGPCPLESGGAGGIRHALSHPTFSNSRIRAFVFMSSQEAICHAHDLRW